ncbi:MAG: hypothetical protein JRD43_00705 [Deltaproteobacteria bacterium]|nr:hypothetical protein [Deltaproteobacteria bacterium]MBW2595062.1 hypothetical protein [Deltaproteobacteria bacterium]MBW2651228.1 hypothetical protein [Deltaproteobacteria bacterium]
MGAQAQGRDWSYGDTGVYAIPALWKEKTFDVTQIYGLQVDALTKEVKELRREIGGLKKMLSQLTEQAGSVEGTEINLRDVSFEEAKKEIAQYYNDHHGETIDPVDIQESLGIDIFMAVEICEKLEKEGRIRGA